MLQQVIATNVESGTSYTLSMGASESDGALIFDIAGIAEYNNEVAVEKTAHKPIVTGITKSPRNIVLTIRITALDVEDKRRVLRSVFRVGKTIRLDFQTTHRNVSIEGMVESCDTPIFVQESIMSVSIMCSDPDFLESEVVSTFENSGTVDNSGDLTVGFKLELLSVHDQADFFSIRNITHGQEIEFDKGKIEALIDSDLEETDILIVDSGSIKKCVLVRDAVEHNIMAAVQIPFKWLYLNPGDNVIDVFPSDGDQLVVHHRRAHEGI